MSFETWTDYGYGIRMDDVEIRDVASVWKLIDMKPDLAEYAREQVMKMNDTLDVGDVSDITYHTIDYDGYVRPGVAGIIAMVVHDLEDISLTALTDYDGVEYLVILPHYPWAGISERENSLAIEELQDVIRKYVAIVSDTPLSFDYYDIENCG